MSYMFDKKRKKWVTYEEQENLIVLSSPNKTQEGQKEQEGSTEKDSSHDIDVGDNGRGSGICPYTNQDKRDSLKKEKE